MKLIYRNGPFEIWAVQEAYGLDYHVYGCTNSGDPLVCPSLDIAFAKIGRETA